MALRTTAKTMFLKWLPSETVVWKYQPHLATARSATVRHEAPFLPCHAVCFHCQLCTWVESRCKFTSYNRLFALRWANVPFICETLLQMVYLPLAQQVHSSPWKHRPVAWYGRNVILCLAMASLTEAKRAWLMFSHHFSNSTTTVSEMWAWVWCKEPISTACWQLKTAFNFVQEISLSYRPNRQMANSEPVGWFL